MSIAVLIIGTILSIGFIVLLIRGKQFDYMIEPLESDIFPLKFIYSVGFSLQNTMYQCEFLGGKI